MVCNVLDRMDRQTEPDGFLGDVGMSWMNILLGYIM